jgi:hypothetical protein
VNLQQLRDYVRMQLDMDDEELPNGMLDSYFYEGFHRTLSMENRWPFYETVTNIATTGLALNEAAIPPDISAAGIHSLIDVDTKTRLIQISPEQAEDNARNLTGSAQPVYYTIWGATILLWPKVTNVRTLTLRGYRNPTEWTAGGVSAEPDWDRRLDMLLCHYAIALCYAQQEDEVLEDVYMKRWMASFTAARNAICNPRHHRPLIMNGGLPLGAAYGSTVAWSSPPVGP